MVAIIGLLVSVQVIFNINDKNILIDTNGKVTKLLFHIIVAINKDSALKNETIMLTEFNDYSIN